MRNEVDVRRERGEPTTRRETMRDSREGQWSGPRQKVKGKYRKSRV